MEKKNEDETQSFIDSQNLYVLAYSLYEIGDIYETTSDKDARNKIRQHLIDLLDQDICFFDESITFKKVIEKALQYCTSDKVRYEINIEYSLNVTFSIVMGNYHDDNFTVSYMTALEMLKTLNDYCSSKIQNNKTNG
jgi:hypothetical protein